MNVTCPLPFVVPHCGKRTPPSRPSFPSAPLSIGRKRSKPHAACGSAAPGVCWRRSVSDVALCVGMCPRCLLASRRVRGGVLGRELGSVSDLATALARFLVLRVFLCSCFVELLPCAFVVGPCLSVLDCFCCASRTRICLSFQGRRHHCPTLVCTLLVLSVLRCLLVCSRGRAQRRCVGSGRIRRRSRRMEASCRASRVFSCRALHGFFVSSA